MLKLYKLLIYHGPLRPFENLLLRSLLVSWSYVASNFYHNVYWYPVHGRSRVKQALESKWEQHFLSYDDGKVVLPGPERKATRLAEAGL